MNRSAVRPIVVAALSPALAATLLAADLHDRTIVAFDRYVRLTEARMDEELRGVRPVLWIDSLPEPRRVDAYASARRGEIVVNRLETRDGGKPIEIPDGLCHHWVATVFAPDASVERVVSVMQSYDRYPEMYRPALRRSRIASQAGDRFQVHLQLFMKKVISVTLNTVNDVHYADVGQTRRTARSYATRIAEVADVDTPLEHEKPVGRDNGFLWRFNNYCSIEGKPDGSFIQCESVSLSRSVPTGLGWLIGPFVNSIPRESLEFTLGNLRRAVTTSS